MKDIRFYKYMLIVNGLVPLALLAWDFWRGQLGANPLDFITRATGTLTLFFLLLSLAVSPARKISGVQWLVRFRRALGLYAFFYGFLHLTTYVWFDKAFDLRAAAQDVTRRPFIAVGMFAFFLLVPLAVTSTDAMIKRLGGKRWQRLHRLAYVAAMAGVLHFYMLVKSDTRKPLGFAAALALLLGCRAYLSYSKRLKQRPLSVTERSAGE
jgi:sulfoxide reductase heme-binding subunit YedZ